jgi:hypothetical protein
MARRIGSGLAAAHLRSERDEQDDDLWEERDQHKREQSDSPAPGAPIPLRVRFHRLSRLAKSRDGCNAQLNFAVSAR